MKKFFKITLALLLSAMALPVIRAQNLFTKVTDTVNPIVTFTPTGGYTGATWVDFNNDGLLDLFTNSEFLFQNLGNGQFSQLDVAAHGIDSGKLPGDLHDGNTWGDFDNDGWVDVYLANRASALFKNNGDGTFSKMPGVVSTNVNAWAAAFGDYDEDGFLDIMATHPCGFIGACHTNYLFKSDGSGGFTSVSNDVTTGTDAYTVGSWSDFDLDGDLDLFVGSGQVASLSPDNIYFNQLSETGTADLLKSDCPLVCSDPRDGQNWNWVDFDNDGDLDGFVTNYGKSNDFYRNDGTGFHKLTQADLDSDLTSFFTGNWLTNVWEDFDNDGDLDVFLGNDGATDYLYLNDGDSTFTKTEQVFSFNGGTRGASAGDYDNDGDVDLFISAQGAPGKGLYNNDGNGNHWAGFHLVGTASNRSAIGAIVWVKAIINGKAVWQMREVSAQNSFCGSNSLRVHFGVGDAVVLDSVVVNWPGGIVETFPFVQADQYCTITEQGGTGCATLSPAVEKKTGTPEIRVFPNPSSDGKIAIVFPNEIRGSATIEIFDLCGRRILMEKVPESAGSQINLETGGLPGGIYLLKIIGDDLFFTKNLNLAR